MNAFKGPLGSGEVTAVPGIRAKIRGKTMREEQGMKRKGWVRE